MLKPNRKGVVKSLILTVALAMVFTSPLMAGPVDVLKDMPSSAIVVISTGPLNQFSQKLDLYAHDLGILAPGKPFNLVDQLKVPITQLTGVDLQIDGSRGMGLAIMNIMQANESIVMYLPVNNPKDVIDKMTSKTPVENMPIWKTATGGVVASQGQFLVIGNDQDIVGQAVSMPRGVILGDADQKLFASADLAVSANLTTLMPMAQGFLAMAAMQNPEIQKYKSLVTIITAASQRIGEIQGVGLGLQLDNSGMMLGLNINARPGSKLAGYLVNQPMTSFKDIQNSNHDSLVAAQTGMMDPKLFVDLSNFIINAVASDPALKDKVTPKWSKPQRKA